MAITSMTIGGVSKMFRVGTLDINRSANSRTTASFEVLSQDGSYRPPIDAEVIVQEDSITILGSLVDKVSEVGRLRDRTGAYLGIVTRVSVVDFNAYTERRHVKAEIPSQSLKATLTALVTDYLSDYGVTLHASQVDGPTLPALQPYNYRVVTEVLNDLSKLTANFGESYIWKIDDSKVLRMYQPSTDPAPFNIAQGDGNTIGDVTVEESLDRYANVVIVKVPATTEFDRVESFTGDGTTSTFQLTYDVLKHYGHVLVGSGGGENLTTPEFAGQAQWTLDPVTNTITREIGPSVDGEVYSFQFDGSFDGEAEAIDSAGVTARGRWEKVLTLEELPEDTTIQAIADAELARRLPVPQKVHYRTFQTGVLPGQEQTIVMAMRNLNGTFLITDVSASDYGRGGRRMVREVTAISTDTTQDDWKDVLKVWAGDKTGSGLAVSPVSAGSGSPGTPGMAAALPDRSVQFRHPQTGGFGGDAAFIYYHEQNSIVCGGGGSSITAASHESCQVFGYNNHIADPA